ncbi:hypothetical protein DUI87_29901 [Hirundo rustica rustica]|uniref:Retroviral nucleocapsid Gag protein p24 C-terminal domain-containing protein n=1 Tax=Hirundo rustica rustica TaxID=333673 RepID=A0A3M0IWK9_HIRRU|nr:hypothetical protein DUI87_29901 [Hirundo rustica rustica]
MAALISARNSTATAVWCPARGPHPQDTRQTPRHGLRLQEPEEKSLDAPLPLVERLRKITLPRDEEDSLKRPAGPLQAANLETPGFITSQEGSTIRDLCKAHRDYGRDSPYFRALLRSDLDAAVVIPADLKQLFSCLLDSTEFKLWVAAWRQQLREALPSLLRDPETAVDDNGNPLTLEHLMGEGRWADPSDQTSDIPIKALQIAREHAVSAFFGMVPDGPVVPYYKIMQGAKESFTKFVERLTRAIEVQVTDVAVRDGILREMVFANANNLCRRAILSLPLDPPPTLPDMLRVCQLKVPYMQGNDREGKSITPRVSAVSGTRGPTRGPYMPQKNRCLICREPGHWVKTCPLRDAVGALKKKRGEGGGSGNRGGSGDSSQQLN